MTALLIGLAFRRLRASGFFGLTVVLSLGLAIGACTAVFSALRATLFPRAPYPEPERVVEIWSTQNPRTDARVDAVPGDRMRAWLAEGFPSLESFAARTTMPLVMEGDRPERVEAEVVSPAYFTIVSVPALLGRTLVADDDRPGAEPAVVLSESFWRERYRGEASALGRTLRLSGRAYTVVGVMPARLERAPRVWVPAGEHLAQGTAAVWFPVAKLSAGATVESATAELQRRATAEIQDDSTRFGGFGAVAIRLDRTQTNLSSPLVWGLGGTAAALYLLALTNLTTLFLVRTAERSRSTAIHLTLGASSWRLGRGLVIESLMLAGVGAAVGLVVAFWSADLIHGVLGDRAGGGVWMPLDAAAFAFAGALALLAALVVGLEPLRHTARVDLRSLLQGGMATTLGPPERRTRNVLLAAQVAVTMVLATLGATIASAYRRYASIDIGYDSDRVVAAFPDYGLEPRTDEQQLDLGSAAITRLGRQLRIEGATFWRMGAQSYPPHPEHNAVFEGGAAAIPPRSGIYRYYDVGPGFFATLGIPVVAGREFGPEDGPGSPAVGIVSKSGAETWWPGQDPIGRRLKLGTNGAWITVVGVARDAADLHEAGRGFSVGPFLRGTKGLPQLYRPAAQAWSVPEGWMTRGVMGGLDGVVVAVRASGDTEPAVSTLAATMASLDPRLPLRRLGTLDDWQIADSYQGHMLRVYGGLVGPVAAAGLLLSLLGIAGAVSDAVVRRTKEIGIRKALGARRRHVTLGLVGESAVTTMAGLALGALALLALRQIAFARSPQLRFLLIGASFTCPTTLSLVGIAVVGVSVAVAVLRAGRADRIEPAAALRVD